MLPALPQRRPRGCSAFFPRKGVIQVGTDADFTLVDMAAETEFTAADMLTKSAHTSWEGMRAKGVPTHTIVRGEVVMRNGTVTGAQGHGRFVPGTAAT